MVVSPALTALDVAEHWPYLQRNLHLSRKPAMERALHLISEAQVSAGGQPARLGGRQIRSTGLTAGEAGNVWRSLRELEQRGALLEYPGRGSRAAAWSLVPDLAHWRGMPWRSSARDVERGILACDCRRGLRICRAIPWSERWTFAQFAVFPSIRRSRNAPTCTFSCGFARQRRRPRDKCERPGTEPCGFARQIRELAGACPFF